MNAPGKSRTDPNRKVWESGSAVKEYLSKEDLYPPEQAILALLSDQLPGMRMLDIGIGGGRTTLHFSGRVKEYTGVDYSSTMIEGCRKRFSGLAGKTAFACVDARDLSAYADASFDFIFFSYNGLDNIGHEDRLRALAEMRRVMKPGGYLGFSSHNLMGFGTKRPAAPGEAAPGGVRRSLILVLLAFLNGRPSALRKRPHAVLRDDGLAFKLKQYYVRPSEQLHQLAALGMEIVRLFGTGGTAIAAATKDEAILDDWIYYLARAPAR